MRKKSFDNLTVAEYIHSRSKVLGSRIRKLREEKGWSTRELGRRVGYSGSTVNRS